MVVRDTDVLLLLLAQYDRKEYTRLYIKSNAPKYFPVHEIRMLLSIDLVDTLIAFHAITGCARYTAWPRLIHATKHESCYCVSLVHKRLCHQSQMQQHFTSHYRAIVWNRAHSPSPDLLPVTEMVWMHLDGRLVSRLLSLPPIPKACREITSCGWTKGCLSQHCSCRKICMECIEAYNCTKLGDNCRNTRDDQE